ncbi:MAG TPA: peptidylprolyl isomerase [Polyangiales bacterium]|nr:peptidylprolyl isomerase [Polyangiales bacterium]
MSEPKFPAIEVPGSGQLYARLHTTQGEVIVRLEEERTPKTVASFVGLATGTIDWKDPKTNKGMQGTPMYDGVRFHRVIPGFMVQVGDPQSRYTEPAMKSGWGRGGPGYRFGDEIVRELKHDAPGVLSMANAGPGTNGSQFFITEGPTPHLDGKHTVFGRVVKGMDIVKKIAGVKRGPNDCPAEDQLIERVELFRSATPPA